VYCTVIKHFGHLRTLEKCRKHSPAARVFYISLVFLNSRRVLSQCNTWLRLVYLLNKILTPNSRCGYFFVYQLRTTLSVPITCIIDSRKAISRLGVVRADLHPREIWCTGYCLRDLASTELAKTLIVLVFYFNEIVTTNLMKEDVKHLKLEHCSKLFTGDSEGIAGTYGYQYSVFSIQYSVYLFAIRGTRDRRK